MKVNFRLIKKKCRSLPVFIALTVGVVTFVAIIIAVSIEKNSSKDEGSEVLLEDTYLKDAKYNYHNQSWGDVAGDDDSVTSSAASQNSNPGVENVDASNIGDSSNTGDSGNAGDSSNTGDSSNITNSNSTGSSSTGNSLPGASTGNITGDTNSNDSLTGQDSSSGNASSSQDSTGGVATSSYVPTYDNGSSATIADSNQAAGFAISAGFKQLYSNGAPVTNVYYYEDNSVYCGQVVTYSNYTIIYLISRTPSFDSSVMNILTSLCGEYASTVWQKFITARVSQSFYIGSDNRLVRIVVPNVDGHYQIVIYN